MLDAPQEISTAESAAVSNTVLEEAIVVERAADIRVLARHRFVSLGMQASVGRQGLSTDLPVDRSRTLAMA
jgi:hypothetical protein